MILLHGMAKEFQTGLDYVSKLTEGTVHLNIDGNTNPSKVFTDAKGVQINKISGHHPAGNVGFRFITSIPSTREMYLVFVSARRYCYCTFVYRR